MANGQVIKQFITLRAVGSPQILIENNLPLNFRNAADSADVAVLKLDASNVIQIGAAATIAGDFLPDNNTRNLGTYPNSWAAAQINNIYSDPNVQLLIESNGTANLTIHSTSAGAASGNVYLKSEAGAAGFAAGSVTVQVGSSVGTDNCGAVNILGGDSVDGQASDISITAGSKSGTGINGVIFLNSSASVVLNQGTGTIDANSHKILNVTNPTGPQDAATKAYVDAAAGGAFGRDTFTLTATDITTNGYVDLANLTHEQSVNVIVKGATPLLEGAGNDYTLSTVGLITRVTFTAGLIAVLVPTNVMQINYSIQP